MAQPFLALALLLSAGLAQEPEGNIMGPYPGVQERHGPLHFCSAYVAIEVAADEQIGWQRGPDFDLYFLQSSRGGFGYYEGNHPQRDGTSAPATVSGLPAERLRAEDGSYSYLVQLPNISFPTFVHLYGQAWKGDDRDLPLLARARIGRPADIGCERRTFQP